jgi:hypothetical protein
MIGHVFQGFPKKNTTLTKSLERSISDDILEVCANGPSKKSSDFRCLLASEMTEFPPSPISFIWVSEIMYYEERKCTWVMKMSHVYYPLSYKCYTCPRGISYSETDILCPRSIFFCRRHWIMFLLFCCFLFQTNHYNLFTSDRLRNVQNFRNIYLNFPHSALI